MHSQEGVTYFSTTDGVLPTVFLGQGVDNLYLDDAGTSASGYAVSNTEYYYTTDGGATYKKAHNVAYAATGMLTGLYEEGTDPGTFVATTDASPVDGKAYYYKDGENYIFCVFMPQQADGLYEFDDTTKEACADDEVAVKDMIYFDKYTKNNGEYYTKVIKVQ